MASIPLAWGPRDGKVLCIVQLDFAPDIEWVPYALDAVLRMSIDFCACSVWIERRRVDPQPPPPKSFADFGTITELSAYFRRLHEEAERNPWIPTVEVIPPTTLFTDSTHPSVQINLGLPPEIAVEVKNQFEQKWQELMGDVRQSGVGPFLDLYQRPIGYGFGPPLKAEYPLNRWGPWQGNGLICVKNPVRRIDS